MFVNIIEVFFFLFEKVVCKWFFFIDFGLFVFVCEIKLGCEYSIN